MDPATRAHLGNYPQTLTHATLVQAALAIRDTGCGSLDRAIGRSVGQPGGVDVSGRFGVGDSQP
jgi:hypothetical protein